MQNVNFKLSHWRKKHFIKEAQLELTDIKKCGCQDLIKYSFGSLVVLVSFRQVYHTLLYDIFDFIYKVDYTPLVTADHDKT